MSIVCCWSSQLLCVRIAKPPPGHSYAHCQRGALPQSISPGEHTAHEASATTSHPQSNQHSPCDTVPQISLARFHMHRLFQVQAPTCTLCQHNRPEEKLLTQTGHCKTAVAQQLAFLACQSNGLTHLFEQTAQSHLLKFSEGKLQRPISLLLCVVQSVICQLSVNVKARLMM